MVDKKSKFEARDDIEVIFKNKSSFHSLAYIAFEDDICDKCNIYVFGKMLFIMKPQITTSSSRSTYLIPIKQLYVNKTKKGKVTTTLIKTDTLNEMYSVKVQLSNAFDEKFVQLIITDDLGVPIHDFTPNVAFDGSKNRACITDNITGNNYFSTDPSKDPSIVLIGTGDLIPPINYKYKCAADSIRWTDDGWIELHKAKANVHTYY